MEEHERRNRERWDKQSDWYQAEHGRGISARPDAWGAWRVPEAELRLLPDCWSDRHAVPTGATSVSPTITESANEREFAARIIFRTCDSCHQRTVPSLAPSRRLRDAGLCVGGEEMAWQVGNHSGAS
jgi:hypothetical protein